MTVDTSVQEKNITYPIDSKLYHRAIQKLAQAAALRGIKLRQSYVRLAKLAAIQAGRYAHVKQYKRMRGTLRKLKTCLGRILRELRRKVPSPDVLLSLLLERCERLRAQRPTDSKKLYSLNEPGVQCISKSKARQRYEFGQEVGFSTTNRGNWIVGVEVYPGYGYDGHTLAKSISTVEKTTGVKVEAVFVDKGYRGHDYRGEAKVHVAGSSNRDIS